MLEETHSKLEEMFWWGTRSKEIGGGALCQRIRVSYFFFLR